MPCALTLVWYWCTYCVWMPIYIGGIVILLTLVILGLFPSAFVWCNCWIPWWWTSETILCLVPSWLDDSIGCLCCWLWWKLWDSSCIIASSGHLCTWGYILHYVLSLVAVLTQTPWLTCFCPLFYLPYPWFLLIFSQVINLETNLDSLTHVPGLKSLVGGSWSLPWRTNPLHWSLIL